MPAAPITTSLTGQTVQVTYHGHSFTAEVTSTSFYFERVQAVEVDIPKGFGPSEGPTLLWLAGHPDYTVTLP